MMLKVFLAFLLSGTCLLQANSFERRNPQIDYDSFAKTAQELTKYREKRRVSEEEFLKMSKEEGTIILDTRSAWAYQFRHIKGAKHLNFSDITEKSLNEVIPNKNTRILIYCNNNFEDGGISMSPKRGPAALNIPTFITLFQYGYKNIYELKPMLRLDSTKIEFNGLKIKDDQIRRIR